MCRTGAFAAIATSPPVLGGDHPRHAHPKEITEGRRCGRAESVFRGAKAIREVGVILRDLRLRLGERVVVAGMGSEVRRCHPEFGQEEGHGLRDYRGSPVRVPRARSSLTVARQDATVLIPAVADEQKVMSKASWHTFQVLGKRPERVVRIAAPFRWGPNIWMGTSTAQAYLFETTDNLVAPPQSESAYWRLAH